MTSGAAPTGRRGWRPDGGDTAFQTCLTLKGRVAMALRQTTGVARGLLRLTGLDRAVPNLSRRSRCGKTRKVGIPVADHKGRCTG
ncbi:MAG: transposase [Rhodobacter sp.]|nr:transposase [Rhodobacter sp.]